MRVLLVLLVSLSAAAQNVSNDSKGFERQYRAVVDAVRHRDGDRAMRAFESFALPAEWFRQTFGASGDALLQQYKFEFVFWQYEEVRRIQESSPAGLVAHIYVSKSSLSPPPKPSPPTIQPLPASVMVAVDTYEWTTGPLHYTGGWGSNVVYVNGAFRFFGVGGYPFWDPIRIGRPDMCAPNHRQPGGQLLDSVNPAYPDEAKNKGVHGEVRLRVNVETDGSVSRVDVMRGDPLLADSAVAAAKQWHYSPFMNCGQPMQAQSLQTVRYSLGGSVGRVEILKRSAYRISPGVAAALVTHKVEPLYPPEAKQAGISGTVELKINIDVDGQPYDIEATSGPPELVGAAIAAVSQWQYKPVKMNNALVEVETTVRLSFK